MGAKRLADRASVRVAGVALAAVIGALIAFPPTAAATFNEFYGGGSLCGSNCYFQSAGAHTFIYDEAFSETGTPKLACQLFNHEGSNEVNHGNGFCVVVFSGGTYVFGRAYNQSGTSYNVTGYAET